MAHKSLLPVRCVLYLEGKVKTMRAYELEREYAGKRFDRDAVRGEREYARAEYTRLVALRNEEERHRAALEQIEQAYAYDERVIERTA